MRTHIFYLTLLSALLILMSIQHCRYAPAPPIVDDIAAILADMPNRTESDQRKRKTLADACSSIAHLIHSESLADTDETIAAFRIETANLRNGESWRSIQERIEALLRKAKSMEEQERIIRAAIIR